MHCDPNRFKVFGPIECFEPVLSGEQGTMLDTLRSVWSPMIYSYSHSISQGQGFCQLRWSSFWLNPPRPRRGDRTEDVGLPRTGKEGPTLMIDSGKGVAGSLTIVVA